MVHKLQQYPGDRVIYIIILLLYSCWWVLVMYRPARRSILLYIPYVVKFGQTARAHYANIQEVRNSGAGCSALRWCHVLVRRVMDRNHHVVIL